MAKRTRNCLTLTNYPKKGRIVIHCSGTPNSNTSVGFDYINELHKSRFPPACVNGTKIYCGYHYIIKKDGTVEKGRPENILGQHAQKINTKSLGICLIGTGNAKTDGSTFTDSTNGIDSIATPAQKASLKQLLVKLMNKYKITANNVIGHHDVYMIKSLAGFYKMKMLKTCPTFSVTKYMTGEFVGNTYADGKYNKNEQSA